MKLKSHRQTMLKLNSRVHSWVTRQENEFNLQHQQSTTTATGSAVDNDGQSTVAVDQLSATSGKVGAVPESDSAVSVGIAMDQGALDRELQVRLKDDVTDLYNSWDEAEAR